MCLQKKKKKKPFCAAKGCVDSSYQWTQRDNLEVYFYHEEAFKALINNIDMKNI
jgi:hypothetical protein